MKIEKKEIITDVLVIGGGGAGSRAAIEIAKNGLETIMTTKGVFTKDGATLTADMDIDLPSKDAKEIFGLKGDVRDTIDNFAQDMFEEGKYMNNEEVVYAHCRNAAKNIKELADWGMKIMGLTQSPGHRYPRGIVSTGRSMVMALKKGTDQYKDKIKLFEHTFITNLCMNGGRIIGALGINIKTGELLVIKCKAVILATGGAMRIYPVTTAPEELTGDGHFMAYEAGAELVDMEFPLFLPSCLYYPESMKGVDFPYIWSTSVGGWWLNKFGVRFMQNWDPVRMEMGTTRDVASVAMAMEKLEDRCGPHGGVYASFKHLPDELINYSAQWGVWWKNFTYGKFDLLEFNMDPRKVSFEVGPASHYWNGGIKINEKCETNVPGLYAAGEVQGGTMGANRLSGNAVTEAAVFGAIAGEFASEYAKTMPLEDIDKDYIDSYSNKISQPISKNDGYNVYETRNKLQEMAFKYVGPVREESGLKLCLDEINKMKTDIIPNQFTKSKGRIYNLEWIKALENEIMLQTLEMTASASLMRQESRGAMYRTDYPETNNKDWLKNIIVTKKDNKLNIEVKAVVTKNIEMPKAEKVPYMVPTWKYEKKS
jgi:succinate dehydrogenase/fumarate reductase flavoprotein subunit